MIITIKGTSGSGKTTLAKNLLASFPKVEPHFVEGRKRPVGYYLYGSHTLRPTYLVGHYETPCGGCDTIQKYEVVFELVREAADNGCHVVYEGLLLAADVKWLSSLYADMYQLFVIVLSTPLQECIDSINARRKARNPDLPPVNPRNTETKYRSVEKAFHKIQEMGIPTTLAHREYAATLLEELLSHET